MATRYTTAEARRRFSELLDRAQQGEDVIIERRGVRFRLLATRDRPRRPRPSLIVDADPSVLAGRWTWELGENGLEWTAGGADPDEEP